MRYMNSFQSLESKLIRKEAIPVKYYLCNPVIEFVDINLLKTGTLGERSSSSNEDDERTER